MATATDHITRALNLLGVIEATEVPAAEDIADGLVALNDMLESWPLQRSFADATTDYLLPPAFSRAIRYNLAVELAPAYDAVPSALIVDQAQKTLADVKRSVWTAADAGFDPGLLPVGARYDILADE